MDLIKFVPDSKEDALGMLAEFIEDCEFTKLAYVNPHRQVVDATDILQGSHHSSSGRRGKVVPPLLLI